MAFAVIAQSACVSAGRLAAGHRGDRGDGGGDAAGHRPVVGQLGEVGGPDRRGPRGDADGHTGGRGAGDVGDRCGAGGKVDSRTQVLGGVAAMAEVRTVGSVALVPSPVARASHRLEVGQAIFPTGHGGRQGVVGEGGRQPRWWPRWPGHRPGGAPPGWPGPPPTTSVPLTSQVDEVGQATEARSVKVVDGGRHHRPLVVRGRGLPTAPASSTGPARGGAEGVAPVGRGTGDLGDVGDPGRGGVRRWCLPRSEEVVRMTPPPEL